MRCGTAKEMQTSGGTWRQRDEKRRALPPPLYPFLSLSPSSPFAPCVLVNPYREFVLEANEGNPQEERLVGQLLQPSFVAVARVCEPQLCVPSRVTIDQRRDAELLREALQLANCCRTLVEIDEMRPDTPLREKAQCLSCLGALLGSENLNFHETRR